MDHANFDTGKWRAYCGQCPVPEVANVFRRAGIPFRSVSGYLRQESAWDRIMQWVHAAGVRAALRTARHGLMGHLYPEMLDVSTDLSTVSTTFGSHVEVLEFDDLRERVNAVTDAREAERKELARALFELDTVADYHRGLAGEQHERLGAGMILGSSILTARGIPMAGEYELRTSIAMLASHAIGAGGSFTEIQALNFIDGVVEMGHDGPAHLAVSARDPLLRGLGVYHGKRGWGVSVEFDVKAGPVTTFGIGQGPDGSYVFITSEGEGVPGPVLAIGNTTSRVDFGVDPGVWVDEWSQTGVGHHWALCLGHRTADLAAAASLLGIEHRHVASS